MRWKLLRPPERFLIQIYDSITDHFWLQKGERTAIPGVIVGNIKQLVIRPLLTFTYKIFCFSNRQFLKARNLGQVKSKKSSVKKSSRRIFQKNCKTQKSARRRNKSIAGQVSTYNAKNLTDLTNKLDL